MTQYLTVKELKEMLPDIHENHLKQLLLDHQEYLNFKIEHNHFLVHASEKEKIKLISQLYSAGVKKEEINKKLQENDMPYAVSFDDSESQPIASIYNELTDMKKLVSFLVQQNEQFRLQQNKGKELQLQLIEEIQELRQTIDEIRQAQIKEYERECEKTALLRNSIYSTQKTIEELASSVMSVKGKRIMKKLLKKYMKPFR